MIKLASGMAAKAGSPRGFMLLASTAVAAAVPSAFWVWGASVPLMVWLSLNGAMLAVFTIVCGLMYSDRDFDWKDADQTPVLWSVMAAWCNNAPPSWFRLFVWMLLIPAEFGSTLVLRPITLAVRALLRPMPGGPKRHLLIA